MRNEEAVGQPGHAGIAFTPAEKRRIALHVVGTVVGMLLFSAALIAPDLIQFRVRMPGHIVLYWFPALMAGRALSGYRGGSVVVGTGGSLLAGTFQHSLDGSMGGFVIAAFVIEGFLFLVHQRATLTLAVLLGVAASLGKMLPKLAEVLLAGATPHHTFSTLPFMFESYVLFGALAGIVYAGGLFAGRTLQSHFSPRTPPSTT